MGGKYRFLIGGGGTELASNFGGAFSLHNFSYPPLIVYPVYPSFLLISDVILSEKR